MIRRPHVKYTFPAKHGLPPCSSTRESPIQAHDIRQFLAGLRLPPPCILSKPPCFSKFAGRDGFVPDCVVSQSVRSPLCDFRVRENRRHSRRLGWRARVSGRQILEFQVWTGGFTAPVSARHFPISVSACLRPVRYGTETGLRSRVSRVTGDVGMKSAASKHFYCRSPMLCSCSAHEQDSALARPVTIRLRRPKWGRRGLQGERARSS